MATTNSEAASYGFFERLFNREKREEYREVKFEAKAAAQAAENAVKYGTDTTDEEEAEIEFRTPSGGISRVPAKIKSKPSKSLRRAQVAQSDAAQGHQRALEALERRIDALEDGAATQAQTLDRGMGVLWALIPIFDGFIKGINVGDTVQSKTALMASEAISGLAASPLARNSLGALGAQWAQLLAAALSAWAYYDAAAGLSSILQSGNTDSSTETTSGLADLSDLALG